MRYSVSYYKNCWIVINILNSTRDQCLALKCTCLFTKSVRTLQKLTVFQLQRHDLSRLDRQIPFVTFFITDSFESIRTNKTVKTTGTAQYYLHSRGCWSWGNWKGLFSILFPSIDLHGAVKRGTELLNGYGAAERNTELLKAEQGSKKGHRGVKRDTELLKGTQRLKGAQSRSGSQFAISMQTLRLVWRLQLPFIN
jgi:hypothetical protein